MTTGPRIDEFLSLMAAPFAGRFAPGAVQAAAEAARVAPPSPSPQAADLLLDAMALPVTEGHAAAAPARSVSTVLAGWPAVRGEQRPTRPERKSSSPDDDGSPCAG